jgi:hypothetical protein
LCAASAKGIIAQPWPRLHTYLANMMNVLPLNHSLRQRNEDIYNKLFILMHSFAKKKYFTSQENTFNRFSLAPSAFINKLNPACMQAAEQSYRRKKRIKS